MIYTSLNNSHSSASSIPSLLRGRCSLLQYTTDKYQQEKSIYDLGVHSMSPNLNVVLTFKHHILIA